MVIILVCLGGALCASGAEAIGQVIAITGEVKATGEDAKVRNLELKSPIHLNDKIVTAKGAKIQVMFNDDSIVSEGEASELVVDQYVYDPKAGKQGSVSLKMAKGVFRVITGKITDMNPDRFKVRTKMATIGIRGCELGFRLKDDREDVYVLYLPNGKTIVITRTAGELQNELRDQLDRVLNITKGGVAVVLEPGAGMAERDVRPFEVKQLVEESTPTPVSTDGEGGESSFGSGGADLSGLTEGMGQGTGSGIPQDQFAAYLDRLKQVPPLPTTGPTEPPPPPGTLVPPPTDRGPASIGGGVGNPEMDHWEWGVWDDGHVEYYPNRYLGDLFLAVSDYQDILDSGIPYTLTADGAGQCGAVVHYGGTTLHLGGEYGGSSVGMTVQINTATPGWGGSFYCEDMDGQNSLSFSVSGGSIGAGGTLDLSPSGPSGLSSYQLSFGGAPLTAPLTEASVNGHLIRPLVLPTPPSSVNPPINGASGEFHFTHGTSASVDGAFGTNLH